MPLMRKDVCFSSACGQLLVSAFSLARRVVTAA
jgi:hypothetical protein